VQIQGGGLTVGMQLCDCYRSGSFGAGAREGEGRRVMAGQGAVMVAPTESSRVGWFGGHLTSTGTR